MKVIVVDDYALNRRSLMALISRESDIIVAGEAGSFQEAVEVIKSIKPDIVIVNIAIRIGCGLEVIRVLKNEKVKCKFIVLASVLEEYEFSQACQMEVEGYVLRNALPEELIYAIRLVFEGRKYYDPVIMDNLMKVKNDSTHLLTSRERQVMLALGQGMSNNQIAKSLFISEFTVKKHITQILSKLNLRDRTEAALYANSKGLVRY